MWPLLIAELTVSAAFVGLLARALWRYDRHLTRIEAELGRDRDAILANVRAQIDAAIAELHEVPTRASTLAGGVKITLIPPNPGNELASGARV